MNHLQKLVDRLGELKAEVAELKTEEQAIKDVLIEAEVEAIEGRHYRACVSLSEVERIDYRKIIERLHPSHQLITAHTERYNRATIRVTARNGA